MKKRALRVFSFLIPIAFILLACGCPEEEEAIVTTVPEGDPLGYIREDEAFISEYRGFYLVRDGAFYSLNDITSFKDKDEYNQGEKKGYAKYETIYENSGDYVYTLGDFELPVISDTDEIRSYGLSNVFLMKVEDVSYAYVRQMDAEGYTIAGFIDTTEGRVRVPSYCKEYKTVVGDEEIETNYNLPKGTEVTISWYEGTDYKEYTAVADTRFYRYKYADRIEFEGELCKEGYATYDFSDVEPGLYWIRSGEWNSSIKASEHQLRGGAIIVIE